MLGTVLITVQTSTRFRASRNSYFCGVAGVADAASVAGITDVDLTSFAFIEQQEPADVMLTFFAFAVFDVEHDAPSSSVHSFASFLAVVEHEAPSSDAFLAVDFDVVEQHEPEADFFAVDPVPQFPPAVATVNETIEANAIAARMRVFMCISLKELVLCSVIPTATPWDDRKNRP